MSSHTSVDLRQGSIVTPLAPPSAGRPGRVSARVRAEKPSPANTRGGLASRVPGGAQLADFIPCALMMLLTRHIFFRSVLLLRILYDVGGDFFEKPEKTKPQHAPKVALVKSKTQTTGHEKFQYTNGLQGSPSSLLCANLRFGRAHGWLEACGTDVEADKGAAPHVAPEGVHIVDLHAWMVKRGRHPVIWHRRQLKRPRAECGAKRPQLCIRA